MRDSEARRIEAALEGKLAPDPATLTRWARELLADRSARTAIIQQLARQAHHAHERIGQAARYLQGLLGGMESTARAPWPGQQACPHCGAAQAEVRADHRPDDPRRHVLTHTHPNGQVCDGRRRDRG